MSASAVKISFFPDQLNLEGKLAAGQYFRQYDVFRNRSNGRLIYFRQTPIERSRFRLWRRIKQNSEQMGKDFHTFWTLTFDNKNLWSSDGSDSMKSWIRWLRKWVLSKYKNFDLKFLWKVEWGSHQEWAPDQKGTARMHIHMACNLWFWQLPAEWFIKNKRPEFVEQWGRGIVQVKAIIPRKNKKGRMYTAEQAVQWYLTKYFEKDYAKTKEEKYNHKEVQGLTTRRWATSQDYKTQTNPDWEYVERHDCMCESDKTDFQWTVYSQNHDLYSIKEGVISDGNMTKYKSLREMYKDFIENPVPFLKQPIVGVSKCYDIEEERYLDEKKQDRKWHKKERGKKI